MGMRSRTCRIENMDSGRRSTAGGTAQLRTLAERITGATGKVDVDSLVLTISRWQQMTETTQMFPNHPIRVRLGSTRWPVRSR